jgi:hypothetical protein
MEWINEPDRTDRNLMHRALVLRPDEPVGPALMAFWQRVLSDGCANATTSAWRSLSIDVYGRQAEQDGQGWMHAAFRNAQRRACPGVGDYFVRSDTFICMQEPGESNTTFDQKQLRWILAQYRALKDAAHAAEMQPLFRQVAAIRPLPVNVATSNGWFDLQIGQDSFGALPGEDQALLAGEEPIRVDPLLALLPAGPASMPLLQELGAALIAYTPPNFETIFCRITEGIEQGQRALFYNIGCPQSPDEGTTVANDRVHQAATLLVQQMSPAQGGFPGMEITLTMQKDGRWQHNFKMLSQQAA